MWSTQFNTNPRVKCQKEMNICTKYARAQKYLIILKMSVNEVVVIDIY